MARCNSYIGTRCPLCDYEATPVVEQSSNPMVLTQGYCQCRNMQCRLQFHCEESLNLDTGELIIKTQSRSKGKIK